MELDQLLDCVGKTYWMALDQQVTRCWANTLGGVRSACWIAWCGMVLDQQIYGGWPTYSMMFEKHVGWSWTRMLRDVEPTWPGMMCKKYWLKNVKRCWTKMVLDQRVGWWCFRSTCCGMVWKSIMNGIGPTCSVVIDKHGWLVLDQRVLRP